MLKQLRKKFIISNMLLVGVVMILMFFALSIITYSFEKAQTIDALEAALMDNRAGIFFQENEIFGFENELNGRIDGDFKSEKKSDINEEKLSSIFLIALCDDEYNVVIKETSVNSTFSEEEIEKILSFAMDTDKESGVIPAYNVRFLKVSTEQGYKIGFADRTSETNNFIYLFRLYLFVTLFILAIMFLISDYMARKAIEPVEKSINEQNRFVADASHELKTPLTVILANMEIMESNPNASVKEQTKWIENTKSEANRMTELVNGMLFLARSDASVDQHYNFQEFNVSNLCEDCVLTFESVAFERGIDLTHTVAPELYTIADETRIKQVIIILLDNALKYVDEKGKIFLTANSNGKMINVTVANTGSVIPKEKQEHLFERFYRADESRQREQGGYGLGLSIAQNIMEAHGGSIKLDYSNEKGTSFSINIPIKQASNQKKLKS